MKNLIFAVLTILVVTKFFSTGYNTIKYYEERDVEYLIGYKDRTAFEINEFKQWFDTEYENYELDQVAVEQLELELKK